MRSTASLIGAICMSRCNNVSISGSLNTVGTVSSQIDGSWNRIRGDSLELNHIDTYISGDVHMSEDLNVSEDLCI